MDKGHYFAKKLQRLSSSRELRSDHRRSQGEGAQGSGGSRKFWWGGDFKHKTSKIRMSSPKLRVIFRPKSKIQSFFSPKIRWSPEKKKKKVFTEIESDFSAEIVRLNLVGGGCIPKCYRINRNRG